MRDCEGNFFFEIPVAWPEVILGHMPTMNNWFSLKGIGKVKAGKKILSFAPNEMNPGHAAEICCIFLVVLEDVYRF